MICIVAKRGVLVCGYFDLSVFDKVGIAATQVTGVQSVEDCLSATVCRTTTTATSFGVTVRVSGHEALNSFLRSKT